LAAQSETEKVLFPLLREGLIAVAGWGPVAVEYLETGAGVIPEKADSPEAPEAGVPPMNLKGGLELADNIKARAQGALAGYRLVQG
jgi:hypothetical protein